MLMINFLLLILLPFGKNFYMLRFGHLLMNYYEDESCTNNFTQIVYSIPDNENLTILNANGTEDFGYSFNYFASQIYYNKDEEDDEEEDLQDVGAFVCNGVCYKRAPNSDILVEPNTKNNEYEYDTLKDKYKAYSCIYNNIIKSATIDIVRYSDKKCKNQLGNEYHFTGTNFCWEIDKSYSFRPLYYEDDEDKIYYHGYNSFNCTSKFFEYFVLNENYLICNSKCQPDRTDNEKFYKCTFNANKAQFLSQRNLLFLLLITLLFNIL